MFLNRFAHAKAAGFLFVVLISFLIISVVPAAAATAASMSSPVPGTNLTSTAPTFRWTSGAGNSRYRLQVGWSWNNWNYYDSVTTSLSASVLDLPSDGRTVYVQLSSQAASGAWTARQYTFKAYQKPAPTPSSVAAVINSPAPGTTLSGSSATFSWSPGAQVSQYQVSVGSVYAAGDIYSGNQGTRTAVTVGNLPQDGRTVYVTVRSLISGTWTGHTYSYTAATATATGGCESVSVGQGASLNGFRPFPAASAWNQDISAAPVDSTSATVINAIGSSAKVHADFGAGTWNGAKVGIPYVVVDSSQPKSMVSISGYPEESDVSAMPIPASAPIEGYPNGGDSHVLVVDKSNCFAYELGGASYNNGAWTALVSTVWDLLNYENRPYTWTSSDAAGLPIFPGLVRYDEVAAGAIRHAIRVTVPSTKQAFLSPATHWASTNPNSPVPMGTRLRLKASYNISGFSAANQVILNAMKKYGLLVADNGSAMFISGAPDDRWNNDDLHSLGSVPASAFEVVQMGTQYTPQNIPTGSAPQIGTFSASAMTVPAGTPVTLSWTVNGASYSFISPQVGAVRGTTATVQPTATTTYVLTSTNQYGRNTASITIRVQ